MHAANQSPTMQLLQNTHQAVARQTARWQRRRGRAEAAIAAAVPAWPRPPPAVQRARSQPAMPIGTHPRCWWRQPVHLLRCQVRLCCAGNSRQRCYAYQQACVTTHSAPKWRHLRQCCCSWFQQNSIRRAGRQCQEGTSCCFRCGSSPLVTVLLQEAGCAGIMAVASCLSAGHCSSVRWHCLCCRFPGHIASYHRAAYHRAFYHRASWKS